MQWRDPCLTFVLPDVMCNNCNYCRDLDLARDAEWLEIESLGEGRGRLAWLCPQCTVPYDSSRIEAALVQIVQKRSMAFQVQVSCTVLFVQSA